MLHPLYCSVNNALHTLFDQHSVWQLADTSFQVFVVGVKDQLVDIDFRNAHGDTFL